MYLHYCYCTYASILQSKKNIFDDIDLFTLLYITKTIQESKEEIREELMYIQGKVLTVSKHCTQLN